LLRQELAKLGEGVDASRRKPLSTAARQQAAKPPYLSLEGREEITYVRNRAVPAVAVVEAPSLPERGR
jgi:hypothetical protein